MFKGEIITLQGPGSVTMYVNVIQMTIITMVGGEIMGSRPIYFQGSYYSKWQIIKRSTTSNVCKFVEQLELHPITVGSVNQYYYLRKELGSFLINLNLDLLHDPDILPLGKIPRGIIVHAHEKTYAKMFMEALIIITKSGNSSGFYQWEN